MISLKSFITAIHEAIVLAADSLMDKNVNLLNNYFTEVPRIEKDSNNADVTKTVLVPKTLVLEYPKVGPDLETVTTEVQVPLITLVPLTTARIEKATLIADFEMKIVGGEVQLDFVSRRDGLFKKSNKSVGRLEITITPQDTPEGLNSIVEAYEKVLRAQIS